MWLSELTRVAIAQVEEQLKRPGYTCEERESLREALSVLEEGLNDPDIDIDPDTGRPLPA